MSQKTKQQNKKAATENVQVSFTPIGWEDFEHWRSTDPKIHAEICRLIGECMRTPFEGLGKPEPLKGDLSGYWSRRITKEHRFVYYYGAGTLTVIACRFHY
ncbi:Txe/YoeB family addiction module toxin [Pseudomonas japonica]|uniref:Txe/YoeB family addiction module toxin n=1 Tax=Pseudomonas japonica TaxID=256466 RepID=UPI0015E2A127|nr:Txe/YoeB family addiction module toxin [Pseudomonas japonica]MBA1290554.1 Txe/YoeB family addiction module toxin [Pseudomonas japonica]